MHADNDPGQTDVCLTSDVRTNSRVSHHSGLNGNKRRWATISDWNTQIERSPGVRVRSGATIRESRAGKKWAWNNTGLHPIPELEGQGWFLEAGFNVLKSWFVQIINTAQGGVGRTPGGSDGLGVCSFLRWSTGFTLGVSWDDKMRCVISADDLCLWLTDVRWRVCVTSTRR